MNVFSNPFRVIWGYSIKKRNVLPLLFSVECRPHCFTHNRTLLIGFTFLLFASFSFRSPSCVQTKLILMDSCLEHPLLLFLHQQIKEIPVGLEMHEWSLQSQTFAKSSIPEGALVRVNLFWRNDFWKRIPNKRSSMETPRRLCFHVLRDKTCEVRSLLHS